MDAPFACREWAGAHAGAGMAVTREADPSREAQEAAAEPNLVTFEFVDDVDEDASPHNDSTAATPPQAEPRSSTANPFALAKLRKVRDGSRQLAVS